MRIDVHAHYWAAEYIDRLVALGRNDLAFAGRQADDLAQRVDEMDSVGVDVQILSAIGLNTEVPDPAGSRDAARCINDIYGGIVERFGGRFRAFGSVPLPFVDEAIAETDRVLGELGMTGIALPCSVDGRPLDAPEFEPFWENLARYDAVVYLHPVGSNSAVHPGLGDWGLHTAYGSPLQLATAATRMVFSGLTFRHPTLKFVFGVCGGILPFLWPRLERNLRRAFDHSADKAVGGGYFSWVKELPLDPDDPMSAFKRFWYDTSTQEVPEALLLAKNTYGVERMLLGSDAIFASLTEAVHYIESSSYLTDEEKHDVLDLNAQKLLNLPAPR
ncbi:putative amidohydrolase (aminocarboxymuconate-semialdehyde decarboxylase) [Lentzea pudingi]|uniref:Amidohydrolase (Aminocarboxymuconate-semialdehyde decarboxylase) n=1 Tax=Lentzea pudingi TaxID=1789439 RepID=A0ABQ2I001_9PSEU|nr:amidohydrolase family protein [Lentzea pudingi]GGM94877.1 putative amidohydrolase (aminocarboxymuconate-semialdehyde decarboxylase) [Lentzea pudingi]